MALTITGLSKTYPNGVKALKNPSLTIGNLMFGLLGPNCAGKSSLMRTVATLQDPDSRSIRYPPDATAGFTFSGSCEQAWQLRSSRASTGSTEQRLDEEFRHAPSAQFEINWQPVPSWAL